MTAGGVVVAGNALLWFAIPLLLAVREIRSVGRSTDSDSSADD